MPAGVNLPAFPSPYCSRSSSSGEEGSNRTQDNNPGPVNRAASGAPATRLSDAVQYMHASERRGKVLVGGDASSSSSQGREAVKGRPDVFTEDSTGGHASCPIPKVNVSAQFERINLSTSPPGSVFQYLNSNEGHGLTGVIDANGKLNFDVKALGDRFALGSGRDMFISLMQRLEEEGKPVSAIESKWEFKQGSDSVNAAEYQKNLDSGMLPEDAAKNTWTGRLIREFGFGVARFVQKEGDTIKVLFVKEDAHAGTRD